MIIILAEFYFSENNCLKWNKKKIKKLYVKIKKIFKTPYVQWTR